MSLDSGSSIFTVGVVSLFRVFRTRGRFVSASGSASLSDVLGCFVAGLPGVLLVTTGTSALSSVEARTLLVVRLDEFDTGGGGMGSVSVSPSMVLSWLLGMSVMPLLVRFILVRAAKILRDLGTSCWLKISIS